DNTYRYILDRLDGRLDGKVDYINAACIFRDELFGLDRNGNISRVTVIECPGLSKEQIYIQANAWFVDSFNSGKSVIQLNEKEEGVI
ncbi:hypothetical protein C1X97_30825, partial [Pseudomonas sp. FW306-2-11AA]|uniref:DUF4468 domain-containing protein n=1 Tax=Pseudomonas sp. FW306-2-11AA TaxID=2070663 RepID=UPI000CBDAE12